jgi:K+/H+ antiporter YhaU regulatory subunit KhtT
VIPLEFLGRLQQELSLTGQAVYESVVAIAERVNRKVHILRLHGQAANLLTQMETLHGDLGCRVAGAVPQRLLTAREPLVSPSELDRSLTLAMKRIQQLKHTLVQVDGQIRELKMETIHEDLLTLQRDLSLRAAAIERFCVMQGSSAIDKRCSELTLPTSVRLVTIFRGPFLIPPSDAVALRSDDIVIAIGLQAELDQIATWFAPARKTQSA